MRRTPWRQYSRTRSSISARDDQAQVRCAATGTPKRSWMAQTSGRVPSTPEPPAPQVTEMKLGSDRDELLEIGPEPGRRLGALGREHLDRQLDRGRSVRSGARSARVAAVVLVARHHAASL